MTDGEKMKFKDKKVIVTGANRSIGRKIAVDFAAEGADVLISYRSDKAGADETVKMIEARGRRAWSLHADFSKIENVKNFSMQAIEHLEQIDVLINNASMLSRETIFEISPELMQRVFQVNTISPLYLSKLIANHMIDTKTKGCIINISSIAATTTMSKSIAYASSKAAMNKWTENAALNLAERGIRVNAIAPGVIQSGMNQDTATTDPELWSYYQENIPLKRTGTPADIANMALFISSDDASWITGKIFEVDGGHAL
jgi:NAD(P)-dependent dehydrogenase (short-subunit alcohol dehydrogenase family)